jgi:hypothetical protein
MTVKATTYGKVTGVEAYVGHIVQGRKFTSETSPSTEQVEAFLDEVASDIHFRLVQAGFAIATKAALAIAAPRVADWLEQLNNIGATARVLRAMPYDADPDSEIRPSYQAMYEKMAKLMNSSLEDLGLSLGASPSSEHLGSGSYYKEDDPFFKRGF